MGNPPEPNASPSVGSPPSFRHLESLHGLGRSSFHSRYRRKLEDKGVSPTASFPKKLAALLDRHIWPWITTYLKFVFHRRHRFLTYTGGNDRGTYDLGNAEPDEPIRVAMAGDWASGTEESDRVAKSMATFAPHYTIHLGDVYYVGDIAEVRENFLGQPQGNVQPVEWPRGSRGSFALNGNHEMYANGNAYFDLMLPTLGVKNAETAALQPQRASFFCLENDYWLLIALDTGYNSVGLPILSRIPLINRIRSVGGSCKLERALCDWLRDYIKPRCLGRAVVLLSHHQYYSAFDEEYPVLGRQLVEFFPEPVLWFWGHEHRLAVYDLYNLRGGIRAYGRCIGHGGMPVALKKPKRTKRPLLWYDDRTYKCLGKDPVGFNGYATLVFSKDTLTVEYLDLAQHSLARERWRSAQGRLELLK